MAARSPERAASGPKQILCGNGLPGRRWLPGRVSGRNGGQAAKGPSAAHGELGRGARRKSALDRPKGPFTSPVFGAGVGAEGAPAKRSPPSAQSAPSFVRGKALPSLPNKTLQRREKTRVPPSHKRCGQPPFPLPFFRILPFILRTIKGPLPLGSGPFECLRQSYFASTSAMWEISCRTLLE